MKRLLLIGLLGGAALGLAWWLTRSHHELHESRIVRQLRTSTIESSAQPSSKSAATALLNSPPATTPASTNSPQATPWATIESKDLVQFIAHLRAIGCPEQTVRDMVTFRICREYRDRFLAFEAERERSWDYTKPRVLPSSTVEQKRLRNAMHREIESLLGASTTELQAVVRGWPGMEDDYSFLALEKRAPVRELNEHYGQLISETDRNLFHGESDPAVEARIKELRQQKQTELAKLLTPEELEALNLRESPEAQYVRTQLPEAKSEEEFRKMVSAAAAVGIEKPKMPNIFAHFGLSGGPDTSDADRAQAKREAQLDARLKEVLGGPRVAEQKKEDEARLAELQAREQAREAEQERARIMTLADSLGLSANDVNRGEEDDGKGKLTGAR